MSAVEVPMLQIQTIPALGGEIDVLKAIQLLPGVQSASEGSTGVYVRGGGPDENLIMLDGVPLYNVSHAMGMFSVFNADILQNVTLYKGNFPARYGSRLSSVIDVEQTAGSNTMWHGGVIVGLISAKLNVQGPIFTGEQLRARRLSDRKDTIIARTTFAIAARRTYYDALLAPLMAVVSANELQGGSAVGGYYFYDVNAKLQHRFKNNDRLSASFYMGDDVIYIRYKTDESYPLPEGGSERQQAKLGLRWTSGNIMAKLQYDHRLRENLSMQTHVHFLRFGFRADFFACASSQCNFFFFGGYCCVVSGSHLVAGFLFLFQLLRRFVVVYLFLYRRNLFFFRFNLSVNCFGRFVSLFLFRVYCRYHIGRLLRYSRLVFEKF